MKKRYIVFVVLLALIAFFEFIFLWSRKNEKQELKAAIQMIEQIDHYQLKVKGKREDFEYIFSGTGNLTTNSFSLVANEDNSDGTIDEILYVFDEENHVLIYRGLLNHRPVSSDSFDGFVDIALFNPNRFLSFLNRDLKDSKLKRIGSLKYQKTLTVEEMIAYDQSMQLLNPGGIYVDSFDEDPVIITFQIANQELQRVKIEYGFKKQYYVIFEFSY